MNEKTLYKTLWGAIAVLLLMNVGMMAVIWFSPTQTAHPQAAKTLFLEKEVGFNDQQKEAYRRLRDIHFREIEGARDSIRLLKDAFFEHLSGKTITDKEIQAFAAIMAEKTAETDVMTFKHFQEVRQLCTPDQQKKFDAVIGKILRQNGRPGPPPPRRESERREGDRPPPPDGRPGEDPSGDAPPPPNN